MSSSILGHQVTLFASGDSVTGSELIPVCPWALRLGRPRTDPMAVQAALIEEVACRANDFDLIHAHIDWLHLPLLSRLGVAASVAPAVPTAAIYSRTDGICAWQGCVKKTSAQSKV